MNAQRWLAIMLVAGFVGAMALAYIAYSGRRTDQGRATPTPNNVDFVQPGDQTSVQDIPTLNSNLVTGVPTVDPVIQGLMRETGTQKLGVGDKPFIIMAGDFSIIDDLHGATGTASIYKLSDQTFALRLDPFKATPGPDLHIIMSVNADPRTSSDALLPNFVDLGPLKSASGPQNYDIPDHVFVARIKSVVVYSMSLNLVFSSATLAKIRG